MPHVAIITSYPFPDSAATANRVRSLANGVVQQPGWSASVIGPHPTGAVVQTLLREEGFQLISCPAPKFGRDKLIGRAIGEIRQTLGMLRIARHQEADLLVVTVPSVFLMLAVMWPGHGRTVVDIRDLVWEYLAEATGSRRWAGRLLRLAARFFLARAAAITVTNEHEARGVKRLCNCEPTLVRNGIARERFEQLASLGASASNKTPFHIVYIGNIGIAQQLDTLIQAVGGDLSYRVSLVGEGTDSARLQQIIDERDIKNVTLTGPLSWDEAVAYYEDADCLYGQIGSAFNTAVPSKLFEYASCGRPVVFAAPEGPATNVMIMFKSVFAIAPGDPMILREKLDEIRGRGSAQVIDSINDRELVRRCFLREGAARDFAELLRRVYHQQSRQNT